MEALLKCGNCRGLLDEEDLFCANCGTEAPLPEGDRPSVRAHTVTHNFECQQCAAQMSYSAQVQELHCPYCDSTAMQAASGGRALAPERVVPFAVERDGAVQQLRTWLGRGLWRPGDLATRAQVDVISAVYMPCWVFDAATSTYWSADSSQTPPGARGDWYPLFGSHTDLHTGLLVPASGVLSVEETSAIAPFSMTSAVAPDQADLSGCAVEQFAVARKYARPLARRGIEAREAHTCTERYVPGRCRNMQVNVVIDRMHSQAVLLPVWVMAYRYRDRVYRFLVNGQTGTATGKAPVSWLRITVAVVVAAAIAIAVLQLLSS